MPKTLEQIIAESGGQGTPATTPSVLPPGLGQPYPTSLSVGGRGGARMNLAMPKPQVVLDQELAQKQAERADPDFIQQQEVSSQNFSNLLTRLERNYESAQEVERGPQAVVSGAMRTVKGALQSDPEASTYYGLRKATLGQAARVISAERGVMTNQDLRRIEYAIPTLMTARETGRKQFGELRGVVADVVKTAVNRSRRQRGEAPLSNEEIAAKLGLETPAVSPEAQALIDRYRGQ